MSKTIPEKVLNQTDPSDTEEHQSAIPEPESQDDRSETRRRARRRSRDFVPIIMCLTIMLLGAIQPLKAQLDVDVSLGAEYTDNAFQLSPYDFQRFNDEHPNLSYARTSDDLSLKARFDVSYPIRYQWWKFTPSVSAIISQNVSNLGKQRQDVLTRIRVDRYYWNLTATYGYYPYVYVRSYVDNDGTGMLERYSYERNMYRADLNLKPLKNTTVQLQGRYDQYYYNQYWTEYDGNATTLGLGLRYKFPIFGVSGKYEYRVFDNYNHDAEDASYASNIYSGELRLDSMPLIEAKPKGPSWHPSLALSYEERFFQSLDAWYGGRADMIYNIDAAMNFDISDSWNLILDYSHTFRNVESPVAAVRRAREFSENKFSATVKYSF